MRQLKITQSITNRSESAAFEKYLTDISKEPMVSADEEIELAVKIKAGDEKALEKLVKANLRFVVSVAKQHQNRGLGLPDLINEGNIGLIKAARLFDETKGFKFISYAVWWIRQMILKAISENSRVVRLPGNQLNMVNAVFNARTGFEQEHEREPSVDELAELMSLPVERLHDYYRITAPAEQRAKSLDAPVSSENEEGTSYHIIIDENAVSPESSMLNDSLKTEIDRALACLQEKERYIIKMYFGIGVQREYSLEEIARNLELTSERVRQLKEASLKKLRRGSANKLLKTYND